MTTDLAVIEAALEAALSADEVLAGFSLDYTPSEWGKARAASDDFDAASREYVAELVERVKAAEAEVEHQKRIREGEGYRAQMAWEDQHRSRLGAERAWARWRERAEAAEATIARVRELAEQHPGTAWNSGLNLRQALRDALGGTPTDAPGGADSADDEQNRFSGEDTAGATEPILRTDQRNWDRPEVALIRHMGGRTYARVGAHKWTELPKFGQVLVTEDLVAQQHEAIAVFIRPTDQRYEPPTDRSGL